MWKKGTDSAIPILIAAITIVAAAFTSAILYLEASGTRVARETEGMLSNGVPSADQLTRVRAMLRHLDGAFDQALLDTVARRPVDRQSVMSRRERLQDDIVAYRTYPQYPFEDELNRELDRELARLDDVMHRLLDELAQGKQDRAFELSNGEWRRQSDRVDDRLRALIAFNIRQVTDHALRIDHIRQHAALVGLAVGGLAMLLAIAATLIAARALGKKMRLQAERAAELELFSARVAHDLMSPLTSVALSLELGESEAHEPLKRFLTRALASTRRMRGIVDGLFDFARSGGQPAANARCDLAPVVQSVVEESRRVCEQSNIELVCEELAAGAVATSPGILAVIASNLVNNAIKFMGQSTGRRITIRAEERGPDVRFTVADSGPGLPDGFEAHAFEPYVRATTSVPGLGLGLATVKRLVCAHGGRVGVTRGENNIGARFWFELPRPSAS